MKQNIFTVLGLRLGLLCCGLPPVLNAAATGIVPPSKSTPVVPVSVAEKLSVNPTVSEIRSAHVFREPLLPVGEVPTKAENNALAAALVAFARRADLDDASDFDPYLRVHPNSPWFVSLQTNLGLHYYARGLYSLAIPAWEAAWEKGKHATAQNGKVVADRAVGELIKMYARLGRMDRLRPLLEEVDKRPLLGSAGELVSAGRQGLWLMENRPGDAFRCGPLALARAAKPGVGVQNYASKTSALRSTTDGTSLAQLTDLARDTKLAFQPAFRSAGAAVIVPSVVHWKVGHYAAIVQRSGNKYHAKDATFGNATWLTEGTLNRESSGYFMVPAGPLPPGWRSVPTSEAQQVWGKGTTSDSDPDATTPVDHKVGGGCGGMGMPYYTFHTMLASLSITDTPVGMKSPVGLGDLNFSVTYNQREGESTVPMAFTYSNLGEKWSHNWLAFLDETAGSSDIALHPAGGGTLRFPFDGIDYPPEFKTNAVLTKNGNDDYTVNYPDGSQEHYTWADGASGSDRRIFLTQKNDASGRTIYLSYDGDARLTQISNEAAGSLNFAYVSFDLSSDDYFRINKVTTSDGRFASFEYYPTTGRLKKITDSINLSSTFVYADTGEPTRITQLQTPYGNTNFMSATNIGNRGRTSYVQATDPENGTERVEFNEEPPAVSGVPAEDDEELVPAMWVRNQLLHGRNSYYWNKKAWMEAGSATGYPSSYAQAHLYHWLHSEDHQSAIGVLESEKAPLERRVWYNYPGQYDTSVAYPNDSTPLAEKYNENVTLPGSLSSPAVVGRRLASGTTERSFVTYNAKGKVTSVTDPLERVTNYNYASNQIDLLSVTRGSTIVSEFTYDRHMIASHTDGLRHTTNIVYRPDRQIDTISDGVGTTTFKYTSANDFALPTSIDGPLAGPGDTSTFGYDTKNRINSVTDPAGHTITYLYDNLDRVERITYPDQTYEKFTYDRLDVGTVRDRLGRTTQIYYNGVRQITDVYDPLNRCTSYHWCSCGHLTSLSQHEGAVLQTTSWDYDVQGRVKSRTDANNQSITYDYEPDSGRLRWKRDAKQQYTNYFYFLDGSLKQITYTGPGGAVATPSVSFTYDTVGRLRIITDGQGAPGTTLNYDTVGYSWLANVDGPWANDTVGLAYNQAGAFSGYVVNGTGQLSQGYDAMGRRNTATAGSLGTIGYGYVPNTMRPNSVTYPSGQSTTFDYKGATEDHRLSEIKHLRPGNQALSKFGYDYDASGRITQWTLQNGTIPVNFQDIFYDAADQLRDVVLSVNGVTSKTWHYDYNEFGNRTSDQTQVTPRSFGYNNLLNQVSSQSASGPMRVSGTVAPSSTVTVNGLSATSNGAAGTFARSLENQTPGSTTFTVVATAPGAATATKNYQVTVGNAGTRSFNYDLNGNCLSDGVRTYVWDMADRLVSVTQGGQTTTWVYDGLGRRGQEKLNGVVTKQWIYAGLALVEERDGANIVVRRCYPQGEEINGVPYYYTRDHLGSVRELTDASGDIVAAFDYDPYGRTTQTSGTLQPTFGFAGYQRHASTGLYLTHYRAYDPDLGRWLSRDPIGEQGPDGPNLYTYVSNNPVNGVDPLGLWNLFNPLTYGLPSNPGENPWNPFDSSAEWGATAAGASQGAQVWFDEVIPFYDPFADSGFGTYDKCDKSLAASHFFGKLSQEAALTAAGLKLAKFRGFEYGKWKDAAGKWQKGTHFHLDWGSGLGKHHLPQQTGPFMKNLRGVVTRWWNKP